MRVLLLLCSMMPPTFEQHKNVDVSKRRGVSNRKTKYPQVEYGGRVANKWFFFNIYIRAFIHVSNVVFFTHSHDNGSKVAVHVLLSIIISFERFRFG